MTNQAIKLSAENRSVVGRQVRKLRNQGIVPANIFGKKIKSSNIQLNTKDFLKVYEQAGETTLINISIPGETEKPVLVSNIQVHPVTGLIVHVDFHQVDLKEKVTATVPVEITGEAPASKEAGMVLLHVVSEIEVEALPTDIPKSFTADISRLAKVGDTLMVSDLNIDTTKVTVKIALDEPIVLIQEQKVEVEPVVVETPAEAAVGSDEAKTDEPAAKPSEEKPEKK